MGVPLHVLIVEDSESENILLKPGPLTAEEWVVMKQHPVYAYEWLKSIEY